MMREKTIALQFTIEETITLLQLVNEKRRDKLAELISSGDAEYLEAYDELFRLFKKFVIPLYGTPELAEWTLEVFGISHTILEDE